MDRLPSQEREKIRKRLRSPEEYERLRDKVKGPEDLEREMEKNAEFAEAKLTLESEPKAQEKAKDVVRAFVAEKGMDAAFEGGVSPEALSKGLFTVTVVEKAKGQLKLAIKIGAKPGESAPSGNVSETLSLKPMLQQQIMASFTLTRGK
jgi:hypothetical protein